MRIPARAGYPTHCGGCPGGWDFAARRPFSPGLQPSGLPTPNMSYARSPDKTGKRAYFLCGGDELRTSWLAAGLMGGVGFPVALDLTPIGTGVTGNPELGAFTGRGRL